MQKTEGQILFEQLSHTAKNGWEVIDHKEQKEIFDFADNYKRFLNKSKTEREFVREAVSLAQLNGFKDIKNFSALSPGDKVYVINREKAVMLAVIGSEQMACGVNILGAHVDSPRIDLKQCPLYQDQQLALFKTHYYGGIKKYQWTTIPLALHGVVIKESGEKVEVVIGEHEDDPVFCITDLLPHLAQEQMEKKMSQAVDGESLNVLVGSVPYADKEVKEQIKLNVLKLLSDKYNILEQDFISAELELVPAFKAQDVGFDRSLIGAYGHDDRACAYAALKALLDAGTPKKTAVCLLVDKEEVGSMGNTGMKSRFFENTLAQIHQMVDGKFDNITFRRILSESKCLSADVGAAVDPSYQDVQDKTNSAYISKGVHVTKYTGSRGKSGSSDASPELLAWFRGLMNKNNVVWQTGELGKVDKGGGGTVAQFIANLDVEVLDCGVPLLSMHAPFEIASKLDIFMTYKAYRVFCSA